MFVEFRISIYVWNESIANSVDNETIQSEELRQRRNKETKLRGYLVFVS